MALLTYAVDLHKAQQGEPSDQENHSGLSDKVEQLDSLLDHLLQ